MKWIPEVGDRIFPIDGSSYRGRVVKVTDDTVYHVNVLGIGPIYEKDINTFWIRYEKATGPKRTS